MNIPFKLVALLASLVCFALALVFLVAPDFMLALWAVDISDAVGFVCRRTAALFAGIGVMLFRARDAAPSPARDALAAGLMVGCGSLAVLGVAEFVLGHAGPGIFVAVVAEVLLVLGLRLAR